MGVTSESDAIPDHYESAFQLTTFSFEEMGCRLRLNATERGFNLEFDAKCRKCFTHSEDRFNAAVPARDDSKRKSGAVGRAIAREWHA